MNADLLLSPQTLTLRRAGGGDLQAALGLLAEAAEWLHHRGVRQWPRGGFGPERIEPLIEQGVLYIADIAGRPGRRAQVAVVAVDGFADPEFWTPADAPADALYVHKLAVSRDVAGMGVGEALLDWAGGVVLDEGRRWLRLDCAKGNRGLQAYYRARSFTHLRTVDLPHRASGALFQRRAGLTTGAPRVRLLDRTAPRRPSPVPA
ncbi:GNAT family N-acetyltransferase [Spongiactinospora sp. TRM90649]|uniref:GNAT family N-acetyltransferase n=1 Tax=Spongiactinospora sp. TRM90649 TaxID=3031114 RepID=UPI0023F79E06|nr:GNAT family N-acetyltransferase [Spongiactinospora sp. TRM90649]MDF5753975.1 GNAT family N-acetyltransferase [Spongiactinospora sp. TRM90649]